MNCTNYESSHKPDFSSSLFPYPSKVQTFSSEPCSQTLYFVNVPVSETEIPSLNELKENLLRQSMLLWPSRPSSILGRTFLSCENKLYISAVHLIYMKKEGEGDFNCQKTLFLDLTSYG